MRRFSSDLAEKAGVQQRSCIPGVHCSDGMDGGEVVRPPGHVALHPDRRVFQVTKAYCAIRRLSLPPTWRVGRSAGRTRDAEGPEVIRRVASRVVLHRLSRPQGCCGRCRGRCRRIQSTPQRRSFLTTAHG